MSNTHLKDLYPDKHIKEENPEKKDNLKEIDYTLYEEQA